jgi:hypothetical protein
MYNRTFEVLETKKLLEFWVENEKQPKTVETAKIRGWLMDALEAKNHAAFDAWMDAETNDPTPYFLLNSRLTMACRRNDFRKSR